MKANQRFIADVLAKASCPRAPCAPRLPFPLFSLSWPFVSLNSRSFRRAAGAQGQEGGGGLPEGPEVPRGV